ncbi:MAG: hypothetical protein JKY67_00560 [Pseudomonadales bacterium]|nr:hypothetical protein [Pseudomonadales bacterium]
MNKKEAEDMVSILIRCQHCLDEALLVAEKISVAKEKEAIRKVVAFVIGEILTEAIIPIVAQHPDLNPYN